MVSIPLNNPPEAKDRQPAAFPTGVVLSLLFHVAIVVLLLFGTWLHHTPEPQPEFVIEMVQLPEKKPLVSPTPPTPLRLPPPQVPQLTEAPIAEKSTPPTPQPAPTQATPQPRTEMVPGGALSHAVPKPVTPLAPSSNKPEALPLPEAKFSTGSHPQAPAAPQHQQVAATQAFQDFILKQITQRWILDVHGPKYHRIVLVGPPIIVRPNGFLAPPFGRTDPWDPQRMIRDYAQLPEDERTALVTFVQAMRSAQPFKLPADGKDGQDRIFQLYFKLGDLPQ